MQEHTCTAHLWAQDVSQALHGVQRVPRQGSFGQWKSTDCYCCSHHRYTVDVAETAGFAKTSNSGHHITPNADEMRDPTQDPHFVSHMPDAFNQQYVMQQWLQEQKQSEDKERLQSKKKADETVVGYVFVQVCAHSCLLLHSD